MKSLSESLREFILPRPEKCKILTTVFSVTVNLAYVAYRTEVTWSVKASRAIRTMTQSFLARLHSVSASNFLSLKRHSLSLSLAVSSLPRIIRSTATSERRTDVLFARVSGRSGFMIVVWESLPLVERVVIRLLAHRDCEYAAVWESKLFQSSHFITRLNALCDF